MAAFGNREMEVFGFVYHVSFPDSELNLSTSMYADLIAFDNDDFVLSPPQLHWLVYVLEGKISNSFPGTLIFNFINCGQILADIRRRLLARD